MATESHTGPKVVKGRIVVVDDEENMCKILTKILTMENYQVVSFTDPAAALEHIKQSPPNLVLTDFRMPELTGLDVLTATKISNPTTNVVVMTAYGTIDGAIESMRAGAFDYVRKPFKTDELLMTLDRALENTKLVEEKDSLDESLRRQAPQGDIIGSGAAVQNVLSMIERIAPTDAAVLIRGESGTGKELVARAIHKRSARKSRRFVAINCASIPENLLESELFGHEKGSFTGADRTKMGLVELAHGGTLFLDEIGDLPQALQAKMLRVLQEREIQRVGGLYPIPVDIRLLAATNRDLKAAIEAKEFRADLFYRLDVMSIVIPPLRDRIEDLPMLVDHFLEKLGSRLRKPRMTISPEAVQALQGYRYPGNVRELENIIERIIVLCASDHIELADIPPDLRDADETTAEAIIDDGPVDYKDAKDAFEREYLLRTLEAAHGNISEAARISGISRRHFHEKLLRLGIKIGRS